MNWRWYFFDFTPTTLDLTRAERWDVSRRALQQVGLPAWLFIVSVAGIATLITIWLIGVIWNATVPTSVTPFLKSPPRPGTLAFFTELLGHLAIMLLWSFILLTWMALVGRRILRPQVVRVLAGLNQPICARCEYSLARLPDDAVRCPECGTVVKPERCGFCRFPVRDLPGINCACPRCAADLLNPPSFAWLKRWRTAVTTPPIRLSREESLALRREAARLWRGVRWFQLASIAIAIAAVPIGLFHLLQIYITESHYLSMYMPMVIVTAPIALLLIRIRCSVVPLRQALRGRGIDVCVSCGWRFEPEDTWLRRCPDCGAKRTPLNGPESSP